MEFFGLGVFTNSAWLLIVGPTLLLALLAQFMVKAAYSKYSKIGSSRDFSGAEAASHILNRAGIFDVKIEMASGFLSDHYDPANKILRLSKDVYQGHSLASVGVAAHEAGHALQHNTGYGPLSLRSAFVPTASLGSFLAWPMIIIGLVLHSTGLTLCGVVLFSTVVLFQIITLPVEFNASSRAKQALMETGVITDQRELYGVNTVLSAAAMTYVAATVTAIAQLIFFLVQFGLLGNGRRN